MGSCPLPACEAARMKMTCPLLLPYELPMHSNKGDIDRRGESLDEHM
jgi:hypothetical protein